MIIYDNITFIPCLHGKLAFALEVRKAFFLQKPKAIAVELPPALKEKIILAVQRLPQISVLYYDEPPNHIVYIPIEPSDAMVEAIRLGLEHDIPIFFIDRYVKHYQWYHEVFPDPISIQKIGLTRYYQETIKTLKHELPFSIEDSIRENYQLFHLRQLKAKFETLLHVGGMFHIPRIIEGLEINENPVEVLSQKFTQTVHLANMSEESIRSITCESPYLLNAYENFRNRDTQGNILFDYNLAVEELLKNSNQKHHLQSGYFITQNQLVTLCQFARNYAFVNGMLFPNLYELVIAARGIDGDNFARILWETAVTYLHYHLSTFPEITIHAEHLFLQSQKITFRPKYQHPLSKLIPIKKRPDLSPTEKNFNPHWGFCSHQPEDIIIEGFGDRLKKKAASAVQEKQSRVEKFSTSYLDGIDIHETMRNWIIDQSIYVRENNTQSSQISTVVVIFDEDSSINSKYRWLMTWQGEHEKESDMMMYSTPLGENIVGPGISRCEYGGFLLCMPPRRMFDVWNDPLFQKVSKSKSETLLYAAIAYSIDTHIVYAAQNSPAQSLQIFANRCGKTISFFSLKQFPLVMLQKIRIFHVLEGHHVRKYAHHYII